LIYRIDDIEPINEYTKQSRTQLFKSIQGMIEVVRKKTKVVPGIEGNAINFEEFMQNLNANQKKEELMDCECPSLAELDKNKMPQEPQPSTSNDNVYQPRSVTSSTEVAAVDTVQQQTMEQDYEGNCNSS
jgi:hypothetical protein